MSQRQENGASLTRQGEKILGLGANSAKITIDHDGLGFGHNVTVTSIIKMEDPEE